MKVPLAFNELCIPYRVEEAARCQGSFDCSTKRASNDLMHGPISARHNDITSVHRSGVLQGLNQLQQGTV